MREPDDYDRDDAKVGYGKPPKRTQLQKGRSGNPRGRPKGAGVRSAVDKVLGRTIAITVDGVYPSGEGRLALECPAGDVAT